jgi:hypothetical protein
MRRAKDSMIRMTIAPASNGSAAHGDNSGARGDSVDTAALDALGTGVVPLAMREERLRTQIALFARAGYRVEQRTDLRVVMVREHKQRALEHVVRAVRTVGVVPLLTGAPRAFHRVLIVVEPDGSVRIL